jgi:glycerate dehydrogenase
MQAEMSRCHAVFLDRLSLDADDLDFSRCWQLPLAWQCYDFTPAELTAERLAGATIAVCNKVVIDAAVMAALPSLRLIAVTATGTNNIDHLAAQRYGVEVVNVTAYATASVVQHTFALILSLVRHLDAYRHDVSSGRWGESRHFALFDHPIRELSSLTLGIVGYGELGRAVAATAAHFGMAVEIAQLPGRPADAERLPLVDLLPRVDILSLHLPLTPTTHHLIGAAELALMRRDAILINTARGGLVDEDALRQALCSGTIGGAAVDVLQHEPPRNGSPLLDPSIPRLIVTPHMAWGSREARQRLVDATVANIAAWLARPSSVC